MLQKNPVGINENNSFFLLEIYLLADKGKCGLTHSKLLLSKLKFWSSLHAQKDKEKKIKNQSHKAKNLQIF